MLGKWLQQVHILICYERGRVVEWCKSTPKVITRHQEDFKIHLIFKLVFHKVKKLPEYEVLSLRQSCMSSV